MSRRRPSTLTAWMPRAVPSLRCPRVANTLEGVQSLLQALAQPGQTVVLYEATGVYGKKLSWVLPEHVGLVCEMNPKIVKNAKLTMSQTKTDPVDARRIAGIARHLYLSEPQVLTRFAINQASNPELAVWIGEYHRLHKAIACLRQQIDAIKQLPVPAAQQVVERMNNELVQLRASQKQVEHTIEEQAQPAGAMGRQHQRYRDRYGRHGGQPHRLDPTFCQCRPAQSLPGDLSLQTTIRQIQRLRQTRQAWGSVDPSPTLQLRQAAALQSCLSGPV